MQPRDQTHRKSLMNCDEESLRLFDLLSTACDCCCRRCLSDPLEAFGFFLALLALLFATLPVGS